MTSRQIKFAGALREVRFAAAILNELSCLDEVEKLKTYDLLVPNWTMGQLAGHQESNLLKTSETDALSDGGAGGMGDAFRGALEYEWMVGGHFAGHPHVGEYRVRAVAPDPILAGVPESFRYDSEQYMLMDPAVEVLADTEYHHNS